MMEPIAIARVCHEANRAYCHSLGDNSQPRWDDAPDWQKESVLNGVKFHFANPTAGPEASHNSWLAEKESSGWVYGDTKDTVAKTHPCVVPYMELPREHQVKDYLFLAIIHSLW